MQVSHNFRPDSAVFDDDNLLSCAGLVPVMTLAEQTRAATDRTTLAEMIDHAVLQALHPHSLLVFLRAGDDWTLEAAQHENLSGAAARLPILPDQLVELVRRGRPA